MTETVEGRVERLVAARDDWAVVLLDAGTYSITAVGPLAQVAVGEDLRLHGQWEEHRKHGRQFHVDWYEQVVPTSTQGIEAYLATLKGLGPELARRLVAQFGSDTLQVIDQNPARLTEVPGIGRVRAKRITEHWQAQSRSREVMVALLGHGLTASEARRVCKAYGPQALAVVQGDPYRLAAEVRGIGFLTADKIAEHMGIPRSSPQRIQAGVMHALGAMVARDGHVFASPGGLVTKAIELLKVDMPLVEAAITELARSGRLVIDEPEAIYMAHLHRAEVGAAELVTGLLTTPSPPLTADVAAAVTRCEEEKGIRLGGEQRRALTAAAENKVLVVTGGPGVGKTTVIDALARMAGERCLALCAPTGRAAKRMSEATGLEAMTIHRLLEYAPREERFLRDQDNPLDAELVIVDEASMLDIVLFHALLRALPATCRLVLVGDVDQLPSVGPGAVLRELICVVPVVRLDEIFRQAGESRIVVNAHRVNRGQGLQSSEEGGDFFAIAREDPAAALAAVKELVAERIPHRFGLDPRADIQVLSPMRRGMLGVDNLNTELQALLNPDGKPVTGRLRLGDRVMQVANDYDLDVFNGDVGRIDGADDEHVHVRMGCRLVHYDRGDLDNLVPAYATTIHKAQGSEYPAVILVLHGQHHPMLQRNLLYTAITRGKRLVVVVGSRAAIARAIANDDVVGRNTRLAKRLAGA